jgi:hypothetical protein
MIDVTQEKLIPLSRAARQLGCSWSAVRAMVQRGELDGVYVRGRLKTSLEAVARSVRPYAPGARLQIARGTRSRTRSVLKRLGVE